MYFVLPHADSDLGGTPDCSTDVGHGYAYDSPTAAAEVFVQDFFGACSPEMMGASQLGGAPFAPTQPTQEPIGTPPVPQGRDRHPPEPLTYPTRQTRAAARRLAQRANKRGRM